MEWNQNKMSFTIILSSKNNNNKKFSMFATQIFCKFQFYNKQTRVIYDRVWNRKNYFEIRYSVVRFE